VEHPLAEPVRPWVQAHPEGNAARLQLAESLEQSGDLEGAEKELRALLQVGALQALAGRRLLALLDSQGRTLEAHRVRQAIEPPRRQLRELKPSRR